MVVHRYPSIFGKGETGRHAIVFKAAYMFPRFILYSY